MTSKTIRIAATALLLVAAIVLVGSSALKSNEAPPRPAVAPNVQTVERLVIRYVDGGYELISRTPLEKVLPPSVELPESDTGVRGSWFEVQDGSGNPVYRRLMESPRVLYSETLSDETPGQIVRHETTVSERIFSVLVPANESARSLALFDQPVTANQRATAAAEVGRITLR